MGRDPIARAHRHARLFVATPAPGDMDGYFPLPQRELASGSSLDDASCPWFAADLVRRDPDAGLVSQREDLDMSLTVRSGVFESRRPDGHGRVEREMWRVRTIVGRDG
jgi:hypothetical protein